MKTPTEASTGAFAIGRISTRSIATPMRNEIATVSDEGDPVGQAGLDQRERDVGRERRHLALGEIHMVRRLVDHHQRQRDPGIDAAGGDARRRNLMQEAFIMRLRRYACVRSCSSWPAQAA